MKEYSWIFIFFILIVGCKKLAELPEAISYINPLLSSGADPWVIQKDSFYYYTQTIGDWLEIYKTKSVSRLGNAKRKIVWTAPFPGPHSHHVWAPELHYLDGKWYLYYAAGSSDDVSTQRIYVFENSSPDPLEGNWTDKGIITNLDNDFFSIDATVLELYNKKYLIWSSLRESTGYKQGLLIAEMTNPWTLTSKGVVISYPQYAWEKVGTEGINEGPEILKNSSGKVFLIYSASTCFNDGYGLGMLTLKNGGNPLLPSDWSKTNNLVFGTSSKSHTYAPGHNSFFKSPDGKEDWIIYHANSNPNESCGAGRNPRIQKFTWNADSTPNFGAPVDVLKRYLRPSGEKD